MMKALKDYDRFVGVDILVEDLESAKKRFTDQPVKLMEMNAESLEFDDNSFDTVCMAFSLHHLKRVERVMAEMHRILRPRGNLIIQEEFCDGKQTEAQKTNLLQHTWDAEIDSLLGQIHNPTFTKRRIKEIIDNLQLESVEIFESTHPLHCLFCERKFSCDPRSKDTIDSSIKEIDDNLQRLKRIADPEARIRLQKRGEELKQRNKRFGNANPRILFAIGRKA